jgi:hypothetical protein
VVAALDQRPGDQRSRTAVLRAQVAPGFRIRTCRSEVNPLVGLEAKRRWGLPVRIRFRIRTCRSEVNPLVGPEAKQRWGTPAQRVILIAFRPDRLALGASVLVASVLEVRLHRAVPFVGADFTLLRARSRGVSALTLSHVEVP